MTNRYFRKRKKLQKKKKKSGENDEKVTQENFPVLKDMSF